MTPVQGNVLEHEGKYYEQVSAVDLQEGDFVITNDINLEEVVDVRTDYFLVWDKHLEEHDYIGRYGVYTAYREVSDERGADALITLIEAWAVARNLHTANPNKQMLKLYEEAGEISASMARGNIEGIKDGIGDVVVVLTILSQQMGFTITECIEMAYEEIKDRKGRMIDGVFVKEADLHIYAEDNPVNHTKSTEVTPESAPASITGPIPPYISQGDIPLSMIYKEKGGE